ncbi:unnamed protein product [Cylindrotheca closterium]|uniref:Peptidase M48 domain-containing protein n=1 Tax=Cylindrotheca closterium TaxID=2856 RepID=A0AAD2JNQ8_9STRA|nr:unnamed protein product [Cylindrotheca closterium]
MNDASSNLRQRQRAQFPWDGPSNEREQQRGGRGSRARSNTRSRTRNNNHRPRTSPKQQILLLLASIAGLGAWYLTPLSEYVIEFMLLQVPIEADMELGRQAMRQEKSKKGRAGGFPPTIHHPRWTPKLQSIGWDLIDTSKIPKTKQYQWDFGVVNDDQMVNAFALPGGVIRVTSGLLQQLHLSDGELAALIGHEMGHVLHRHSQARILQQEVLQYILKALVYQDDDPHQESFGEAIGELMVKSADWLGQQSFSRSNEYQADAASWDLLVYSSKYNPQALQSLLNKLWEYHGKQGGKTSWDSTHPGTLDRIGALDKKWESLSYQEKRKLARNTLS